MKTYFDFKPIHKINVGSRCFKITNILLLQTTFSYHFKKIVYRAATRIKSILAPIGVLFFLIKKKKIDTFRVHMGVNLLV